MQAAAQTTLHFFHNNVNNITMLEHHARFSSLGSSMQETTFLEDILCPKIAANDYFWNKSLCSATLNLEQKRNAIQAKDGQLCCV